jgi:amidase
MSMTTNQASWEERVAQTQAECVNKIPSEWRIPEDLLRSSRKPLSEHKNDFIRNDTVRKSGVLTARELDITEKYTVRKILAGLANGSLTSTEVTTAYCKRAAVAQQLV